MNENKPWMLVSHRVESQVGGTYRKDDVEEISKWLDTSPIPPFRTPLSFFRYFQTAELLRQPPSSGTVSHLDIRQPDSHDRYKSRA